MILEVTCVTCDLHKHLSNSPRPRTARPFLYLSTLDSSRPPLTVSGLLNIRVTTPSHLFIYPTTLLPINNGSQESYYYCGCGHQREEARCRPRSCFIQRSVCLSTSDRIYVQLLGSWSLINADSIHLDMIKEAILNVSQFTLRPCRCPRAACSITLDHTSREQLRAGYILPIPAI